MKLINKFVFIVTALIISKNIYCSQVQIHNASLLKIETSFDLIAYPDTKKTISENSTYKEDIGKVFLRGISVGVHIGNQFIENALSENLSRTLGFGDIEYYVFAEVINNGRKSINGDFLAEIVLYLMRLPKSIFYKGGIVSTSKTIKVCTKDFEHFTVLNDASEN